MSYGRFLLSLLLLGAVGCASSGKGEFKQVSFPASSRPFPALRPVLQDADVLGVLSATNIEPVRELDIEKVMGRLTDAVAVALGDMPGVRVITQDEIRWHFKETALDSARVFAPAMQQALREELEIDVLVYLELKQFQALLTSGAPTGYVNTSPSPYDRRSTATAATGLDLTVDLELIVSNLQSGAIWRQQGEQKSWQPIQLQFFGDDQTERHLMAALSNPLRRFIYYIAPPPSRQVREFEISGD